MLVFVRVVVLVRMFVEVGMIGAVSVRVVVFVGMRMAVRVVMDVRMLGAEKDLARSSP